MPGVGMKNPWSTTAELVPTGGIVVGSVATRSLGRMSEEDLGPVSREARVKKVSHILAWGTAYWNRVGLTMALPHKSCSYFYFLNSARKIPGVSEKTKVARSAFAARTHLTL